MIRPIQSNLLRQLFLVVLVGQVLLGLANSLFVLSDVNIPLSLFGFYGGLKGNLHGIICVLQSSTFFSATKSKSLEDLSLFIYIVFSSVLSSIADVARIFLWEFTILSQTLGHLSILQTYYMALTVGGIALKIVAGIFAYFIARQLQINPTEVEGNEFLRD